MSPVRGGALFVGASVAVALILVASVTVSLLLVPTDARLSGPGFVAPAAPRGSCVLPPGFVHLRAVAPTVIQELRYSGFHNFVGRPVRGYDAAECILTAEAAAALARVQRFVESGKAGRGLNVNGPDSAADSASGQRYSLKVYDCYRPTAAVGDFVRWAQNSSATEMAAEFYPDEAKSRLFADGYIAERSGHSRGSTVDLTLVSLPAAPQPPFAPGLTPLRPCTAPLAQRWPDNSVDMGTGFDCFSPAAWTNDSTIPIDAQFNRLVLLRAMAEVGWFENYELEWWHFTLRGEPFPDSYFNFTVC